MSLKEALFPTPPPPATVSFGKLPQIAFPASVTTNTLSYTLSTLTGFLPSFGDKAVVYPITQPSVSFSILDKAKTIAAQNNFTDDPIQLSDLAYQWTNTSATTQLTQNLTMNALTLDFSFSTNYLTDSTVQAGASLGTPDDATQTVSDFLNHYIGAFPSDVDPTKPQLSLFAIQNDTLVPVTKLTDAKVIRVDFYQNPINQIPLFYPHFPASLIEGYVASGPSGQQVVAATFVHKIINASSQDATYPLKTTQEAFDELKKGFGYIASYDTPDKPVTIRNVVLGYYISDDPLQKYVLPIIVFVGDNNFYGFVSAVTNEWVQK